MKLRTRGHQLAKLLAIRIPEPLILAGTSFQTSLLLFAVIVSALVGAVMWMVSLQAQFAFALSLLCLTAWAATPLFVELLLGMSAAHELAVAHYVVAALIATLAGLTFACAAVWTLGEMLPRFYLAAAATGTCAPALLLGYALWYCRGRPELQRVKE